MVLKLQYSERTSERHLKHCNRFTLSVSYSCSDGQEHGTSTGCPELPCALTWLLSGRSCARCQKACRLMLLAPPLPFGCDLPSQEKKDARPRLEAMSSCFQEALVRQHPNKRKNHGGQGHLRRTNRPTQANTSPA